MNTFKLRLLWIICGLCMFAITFDELKGGALPQLYDSIAGAGPSFYDVLPKVVVMCLGSLLVLAGMLYRHQEGEAKEFIIGVSGVLACASMTFLVVYF